MGTRKNTITFCLALIISLLASEGLLAEDAKDYNQLVQTQVERIKHYSGLNIELTCHPPGEINCLKALYSLVPYTVTLKNEVKAVQQAFKKSNAESENPDSKLELKFSLTNMNIGKIKSEDPGKEILESYLRPKLRLMHAILSGKIDAKDSLQSERFIVQQSSENSCRHFWYDKCELRNLKLRNLASEK